MSKTRHMENESKKWSRSISPVGWYVASVLVRLEWHDEDKNDLNRRCLSWENQIIIRAGNPEEAYAKAVEQGKSDEEQGKVWAGDNKERTGTWRFEGLTSLLPIYDEFEDGSEIVWKEHKNRSVKKVKSWAKAKEELEVFDGT